MQHLKTENPQNLLSQISQIAEPQKENSDQLGDIIQLKTEQVKTKRKMVQEVSGSEFEQNLKKNYAKQEKKSEKEEGQEVKTLETLNNQINEVATKKLAPKKPLFGRAYAAKDQVNFKFLLNEVENDQDVFFYLPKQVCSRS